MQTLASRRFAIIAPPPTPNGDLHVGHLSGPYLGVDILSRYLALRGAVVDRALSVDLNQTYVVTTAERLGRAPHELATASHAEIQETLAQAAIGFDVVGMPDAAYTTYVTGWFQRLNEAGVFRLRRRVAPFDPMRGRFMFEAYASGSCPTCLAPTKANICEGCGHANQTSDLIGFYPTGGAPGDPVIDREFVEYVFDLEEWREPMWHHLSTAIPELRPGPKRLVAEMFDRKLPMFPITFPSNWGIPAPFAQSDGLVLNVWAEMVPGHYHWLNKASCLKGANRIGVPGSNENEATYCQFLGFDNSFFYIVAHLGLALAARHHRVEALVPDAFITNEFLQLENYKFSTSQGHLIWGRDLLAEVDRDDVRFYLAWINPEYNQSNFTRADLQVIVSANLREPLDAFLSAMAVAHSGSGEEGISPVERALLRRFEAAYGFTSPSARIAAQTISHGLKLGIQLLKAGATLERARMFARTLAVGTAPIAPTIAEKIWAAAGQTGPIVWPADFTTPLAEAIEHSLAPAA